jgi:hypothetical protein
MSRVADTGISSLYFFTFKTGSTNPDCSGCLESGLLDREGVRPTFSEGTPSGTRISRCILLNIGAHFRHRYFSAGLLR